MSFKPSASIEVLKKRAMILKQIRAFFDARDVLEVETPVLSQGAITDPNLNSFSLEYYNKAYYLQTSPEFHMKRLLAADSGPIFQIGKAFRHEEQGRFHNPEFTMLEWYRVAFDHHDLMQEMDELLRLVLNTMPAEKTTYKELFEKHLKINPFNASIDEFKEIANHHGLNIHFELDYDGWLNLLMSHLVEPDCGKEKPVFVYDYPASQSALAKINPENKAVAERFEVYYKGIELANGFHELTDANEQRDRFEKDLVRRAALKLPGMTIDENFLQALEAGLPDCAGVALGVDRLIMLAINADMIKQVVSFDVGCA